MNVQLFVLLGPLQLLHGEVLMSCSFPTVIVCWTPHGTVQGLLSKALVGAEGKSKFTKHKRDRKTKIEKKSERIKKADLSNLLCLSCSLAFA